jgi:DNA uptake protein ComE-like DNA-binding protein
MQLKKYVREWIYFSKKERLGVYIMGSLIALLWILPTFFAGNADPLEPLNFSVVQLDSMEKIMLKGKIVQSNGSARSKYAGFQSRQFTMVDKKQSTGLPRIIDLNTADSTSLEELPGIGEKLSARIIKYRERLGGYIFVDQLKEVYGLADSNFLKFRNRLKIENGYVPIKVQINKATYPELRRHPYISHLFATSVLAFKKMHDSINSIEELLKIGSLDEQEVLKVAPYIDFRP